MVSQLFLTAFVNVTPFKKQAWRLWNPLIDPSRNFSDYAGSNSYCSRQVHCALLFRSRNDDDVIAELVF